MKLSPVKILIAGGGTGGHLFPGIAIARAFMEKDPDNQVRFVGTDRPFEKKALDRAGFGHEALSVQGLRGRGIFRQVRALFGLPWAVFRSMGILWRFGPDLLIGVGGYAAGPVAVAAWLWRIPVVIQEQNSRPGITNQLLARIARRVYVSFENTPFPGKADKIRLSGNPVRPELLAAVARAEKGERFRTETGGPTGRADLNGQRGAGAPLTVLILGGSQGAHGINLALTESLDYLKNKGDFYFIHQSGPADYRMVRAAYGQSGVPGEVKAFFHEMGARYARADLVIARAGATTVAEITAIGKAAIFVPFPFATDDHQARNARALVAAGAAEMIRQSQLDPQKLARKLEDYAQNRQRIQRMAQQARALGRPGAAAFITNDCYQLMGKHVS